MNLGVELGDRRGFAAAVGHGGQAIGAALPRQLEREQFVHRDAERKNVEPVIGRPAADHFGGHVVGCPRAIARQHVLALGGDGEAEVDQFERRRIFRADEIAWANVAVNETCFVDGIERLSRLPHQRQPITVEQRTAGDDQRIQTRPVEELHDKKLFIVRRDSVRKSLYNLRMIELDSNLAFSRLFESFEPGFQSFRLFAVENLEADDLFRLPVTGLMEIRHRSRDRVAQDFVPPADIDLASFEDRLEEFAQSHLFAPELVLRRVFCIVADQSSRHTPCAVVAPHSEESPIPIVLTRRVSKEFTSIPCLRGVLVLRNVCDDTRSVPATMSGSIYTEGASFTRGTFVMIRHAVRSPTFRRHFASLAIVLSATQVVAENWTQSPWFPEQTLIERLEPEARMYVNSPVDDPKAPARSTRVMIYALPNGNAIEQTLGCQMRPGLDWHYDIQHVAAQVRLLRSLTPEERLVLVCVEADSLSWPAWRGKHENANQQIATMADDLRRRFGGEDAVVTLTGHSGGGSFDFGVIEGSPEIPDWIDRIAFLDSNYAFDAELHAEKFKRWLNGDDKRRLIVVAYDDREITFNGKKVVGPDGGTFRATNRMVDAFKPKFEMVGSRLPPFAEFSGLDGRVRFYVHSNPENKILHTALVGEMNGLAHVQTLGTSQETKWGNFGGPRAYTKWVQSAPDGITAARFPDRPTSAIGGAAFMERVKDMSLADREAAAVEEITSGNFPQYLRKLKSVAIETKSDDGKKIVGTLEVMPDYLAVGSDEDFVRLPITPQSAQRIADALGCTLPTRKMVDAIDAASEVHLEPRPLTENREDAATFLQHHQIIEDQRQGHELGQLVAGIKKDVVLTPRIFERTERLAIYGWRKLDGEPIQPLTIVHWDKYVDYSHGARLVNRMMIVDGQPADVTALLEDPARCSIVSDEGKMKPGRYPE